METVEIEIGDSQFEIEVGEMHVNMLNEINDELDESMDVEELTLQVMMGQKDRMSSTIESAIHDLYQQVKYADE